MQALTLAKHEAQGAVLSLVLSSDANAVAFSDGQGTGTIQIQAVHAGGPENGRKKGAKRALFVSQMVLVNFAWRL
jgi:hypothetical protein